MTKKLGRAQIDLDLDLLYLAVPWKTEAKPTCRLELGASVPTSGHVFSTAVLYEGTGLQRRHLWLFERLVRQYLLPLE